MGPAATDSFAAVTTVNDPAVPTTTTVTTVSTPAAITIPPEVVNALANQAQQAVSDVLPQVEAAARDLIATELARFKANPTLQDYAIFAAIAVVFVVILAVFGSALAGNLYAQTMVAKAGAALVATVALLVHAFSGSTYTTHR